MADQDPPVGPGEAVARTVCKTALIHPTDHPDQPHLLQIVEIYCPDCGNAVIHIHGHHLRSVYEAIGRTLEDYPELCRPPVQSVDKTPRSAKKDVH